MPSRGQAPTGLRLAHPPMRTGTPALTVLTFAPKHHNPHSHWHMPSYGHGVHPSDADAAGLGLAFSWWLPLGSTSSL